MGALCIRCHRRPKQRLKNRLDCFCTICRAAYSKEHYGANKVSYNLRRLRNMTRHRREMRAFVAAQKKDPCQDCGETHPHWAMEFDHRPGVKKLFNIGDAPKMGLSMKRLVAEIAKCDLVCVLCHRYRTNGMKMKRFGV